MDVYINSQSGTIEFPTSSVCAPWTWMRRRVRWIGMVRSRAAIRAHAGGAWRLVSERRQAHTTSSDTNVGVGTYKTSRVYSKMFYGTTS